jgi:hypothetical protein
MKKYLLIFILSVLFANGFTSYAQEQEQNIENYKTDFSFGLNINSMSGLLGGINFKYARQIKPLHYRIFFAEFVNIKHPKEDSRIGNSASGGETFVPGKLNYLTMLRTHYGREIVLFRPANEQGVQINFVGSVGATFGFEIPYYVEYIKFNSQNRTSEILIDRYDPNNPDQTFGSIVRSRGILGEGLGKMSTIYGASAKIALSFRFNAFRNTAVGLEGGTMVDVMNKKTQIMVGGEDRQVYHTFFLTLFYAIQGK